MPMTPLPSAPLVTDTRATFSAKAFAWVAALVGFVTEGNALETNVVAKEALATTAAATAVAAQVIASAAAASAVNAPGTNATSTTSLLVGLGDKTLTIQTGKAYAPGMYVLLASQGSLGNSMAGQIVSHDPGTGALVVRPVSNGINGSGTYADWSVSITSALQADQSAATQALAILNFLQQ